MVISFISYTLIIFSFLVIASLAGMMSERAGVVNISIEGMMTIGALVYAILDASIMTEHNYGIALQILVLLTSILVGMLFSLLHAFAAITLKADQTVVGTAINLLAQGIALFLAFSGVFGDSSSFIHGHSQVIFLDSKTIISGYLILAVILTIVIFLFFKFTKTGLRYQSVGENPNAVDAAAINVIKYRYLAVMISGGLAALAGDIYLVGYSHANFYGTVQGFGFLALAIMICGQWRAQYIALVSLLFSLLLGLADYVALFKNSGEWVSKNKTLFQILPFVGSLVVMVVFSKKSRVPKANGIAFDKALR